MSGEGLFLGRPEELAALEAETHGRVHLVALWGAPGIGKSALARHHVERERALGRPASWVDVSRARTKSDLLGAIATELGVTLDGSDDVTEAVVRSAETHGALLVIDNADRLDPEARAAVAEIAEHARILVTTRDAFEHESARLVPVGPLAESDALSLFSALSGTTADEIARAIVRRVDAVPLAIVLAAARAPMLGNAELLARLGRQLDLLRRTEDDRNGPVHHATLRAAIAWSWDLLESSDRSALMGCATFEDRFDTGLAEIVLADGLDPPAFALDCLERLRMRALVQVGPADAAGRPQLFLLEVIREFVREEMARAGAGAWSERHARAVVERAEPAAEAVRRGRAVPAELAARRRDLLRCSTGDAVSAQLAARATIALSMLLLVTGPLDVVVERTERAAARLVRAPSADARLEARLALARGEALRAMGRLVEAELAANEAMALAKGSASGLEADALRLLGVVARSGGNAGAIELLSAALERYRSAGERALAGICIDEIGAAHQSQSLELARRTHEEAIAVHVVEESRRAEGGARSRLAVVTHRLGHPAAALPLHEEALRIHRDVGDRRMEGAELIHVGFVHHELGAPGPARVSLTEGRRVLGAAGARGLEALAMILLARLDVDEGDAASARVHLVAASAASPASPRAWARLEATRLVVAGHLSAMEGDADGAIRAYEAALATNRDVEVGFEALTPAYLAVARSRSASADDLAIRAGLEAAQALVAAVPNRTIGEAFAILAAAATNAVVPSVAPSSVASSSEVRRALSLAGSRRAVVIADEARQIVLPDGRLVDLARRKNVRLMLLALANARRDRPGIAVSADALIAIGWPGERMSAETATKRLHTAIWTLRSLGLGALLASSDDGYWLDATVRLEFTAKC